MFNEIVFKNAEKWNYENTVEDTALPYQKEEAAAEGESAEVSAVQQVNE